MRTRPRRSQLMNTSTIHDLRGMKQILGAVLFLAALCPVSAAQQAQTQQQPEHAAHHHGDIKPVEAHYPQLGREQSAATTPLMTLEQLQKLARENNPTLRQAEAEIRAAEGR